MTHKIYLTLCLLALLCACHSPQSKEKKRTLTVSIEPMRYFAEQIGGDIFEVVCMIPQGGSPETYEPTPRQMLDVAHSEAYLRVGPIPFEETWLAPLSANAPQMQVADMSAGVEFIREADHVHSGHTHDGGADPHIWTSPANVRLIAANIYTTLCRLSPADTALFRQRWERLDSLITATDREIRHTLAAGADSTFLLYHPSLGYFARDYGLRSICLEEGGRAPSLARLKEITEECRRTGTRVIFVQQGFDTRHAEGVAKETKTRIVEMNPLAYDWPGEMRRIAEALAERP